MFHTSFHMSSYTPFHISSLLLISLLCLSCGQMEDPFAHVRQIHQAKRESIDRKQEDPLFSPEPPGVGDPPHYFWEERKPAR